MSKLVQKMNCTTYLQHGLPVVDKVAFALEAVAQSAYRDVDVLIRLFVGALLVVFIAGHF